MASAQDSDVLQQAGSIWKMLDEMSLKNPKEYDKLMKKVKEGEDEFGPPKARFSFCTTKVLLYCSTFQNSPQRVAKGYKLDVDIDLLVLYLLYLSNVTLRYYLCLPHFN